MIAELITVIVKFPLTSGHPEPGHVPAKTYEVVTVGLAIGCNTVELLKPSDGDQL